MTQLHTKIAQERKEAELVQDRPQNSTARTQMKNQFIPTIEISNPSIHSTRSD